MDTSAIARVEGPNLTLRLIEPDDAAYVHGLRTNPSYNSHLSKVTGSVEDQQQWIEDYKEREAALESAMLSFGVGFEMLHRDLAKVDARSDNAHAAAFYRRLGMTETHRTAQDIYFSYPWDRFASDKTGYTSILEQEKQGG